jgi:hypothetical protein
MVAGQVMILEMCHYTLKEWLASLSDVSTDDLDNMINFTLNIAQGVAHLHANKVMRLHGRSPCSKID